jgi:pyruvate-formate lyase
MALNIQEHESLTKDEQLPAAVTKLRENLLDTMPSVCAERARLVTEAYRRHAADPVVLRRAKALAHVLEYMTIFIQPDEIIVGNQASKPRAAPIFPEYSVDWIPEEIDEFHSARPTSSRLIQRSSANCWRRCCPTGRGARCTTGRCDHAR